MTKPYVSQGNAETSTNLSDPCFDRRTASKPTQLIFIASRRFTAKLVTEVPSLPLISVNGMRGAILFLHALGLVRLTG